jgi:pimeloyl-ACP methyl ester carboxylesterase
MYRQGFEILLLTASVGLAGCWSGPAVVFQPARLAARDYRPPPAPLEDLFLHLPEGTKIHARWCPHPRGQGAILYCPGATGNLHQRAGQVQALLQAVEEPVLIFDYPGYGFSEGQPSLAGCCAAAEAAYHWLRTFKHLPPERLILYGETLGATVALELGSRQPARALILVCPLPEVHDKESASSLASEPAAPRRLDCLKLAPQCQQPIFLALEKNGQQAQQLASVCAAHGEVFYLPHNGRQALPAAFYQRLRLFLQTRASLTTAAPPAAPPAVQIGMPIPR